MAGTRKERAQGKCFGTAGILQRLRQAAAVYESQGTVRIQRPRVRDLGERFKSTVLPMFKRQTKQVRELIPELYLHGLASGDFELALRQLLGEGAPLSASPLQWLKEKWRGEYEQWKSTAIEEKEWAYLWADGYTSKRD